MLYKKYSLYIAVAIGFSGAINISYAQSNMDNNKSIIINKKTTEKFDFKNKNELLEEQKKDSYKKIENKINISKMKIEIPPGSKSDFLTVYNNSSKEEFGFTVEVKKWKQENGKDILLDSPNILVAPKTFVIKPNQHKNIRIMAKDYEQAIQDYSYRVIIKQISRKDIEQEEKISNQLKINISINLPLTYLSQSFKEADKMNVNARFEEGNKYLVIENKDKQYLYLHDIIINEKVYKHGWYILPGNTIRKEIPNLPISPKYNIELTTDRESVKKEIIN